MTNIETRKSREFYGMDNANKVLSTIKKQNGIDDLVNSYTPSKVDGEKAFS